MHRPLDLNFHRESLDGRNRCPSISPWTYDKEKSIRCEVEKDHPDLHSGGGRYWADDQARKPKKITKWAIAFWIAAVLNTLLFFYSIVQLFINPNSDPTSWYMVSTWVVFAALVITVVGYVHTKHKKVKVN